MKKLLWLVSAVTFTSVSANAESGRITISSANGERQVNIVAPPPAQQTLSNAQIDDAINELMGASSGTSRLAQNSNLTPSNHSQSVGAVAALSGSAPATAARLASRAAHGSSQGRCALYVRKALQGAGYQFTSQASAYMYANGTLASAGFTRISSDNYVPQVGDVVVFNRTSKNPHGHIQIYDGRQWVSDFRQPNFSPYRNHNGYSVWRDVRHLDATANTGTVLAMNE
ncbi:MAG: CHAP domain-containing protein [Moraxella sp.]|uniref:CHAP domain-containing protein n=1 Tax=Moraxella sp. TaxID=479 RepID=UPI0026DB6A3D|nr:CHAP domain-containing protein [Moraxella sp.]MDO4450504.1 CHAP domain-containing protein [Moraxella sp.]